jgi:hypothetical protein
MTLVRGDLPAGARLVSQHRLGVTRGTYERTFAFSPAAARRAGMTSVDDTTVVFRQEFAAFLAFVGLQSSFADPRHRHRLATAFARRFHLSRGRVRVSRPLDQHLGDGAFATQVTVHRARRRIRTTFAVLVDGPVLSEVDVVGAPGAGRILHRTHRLLLAVRAHIRAVLAPVVVARPVIAGTLEPGAIVQATPGAWRASSPPRTFHYQWQRCTGDGTACASIDHATRPSYTVRARDEGSTLRVLVTAVNGVGRVIVGSAVSAPVGGAPPVPPPATVPYGTPVLGRSDAQWEVAEWRRYLAAPRSIGPDESCAVRQHPGLWFLAGLGDRATAHNRYHHDCSVPAGTYLLLPLPGDECSTVEPPPYHASGDRGLHRCARRQWSTLAARPEVTLDGRPVALPPPSATPVFAFSLPRRNVLFTPRRHGRAAAYGRAIVFPPLAPGRHTIVKTTDYGGAYPERDVVTFHLRVG